MGHGARRAGGGRLGGVALLTRPWAPQHNTLLIEAGPPPPPSSVGHLFRARVRGAGCRDGLPEQFACHLPSPQPCPLPSLRSIPTGGMPTHLPAFQCPYHLQHTWLWP